MRSIKGALQQSLYYKGIFIRLYPSICCLGFQICYMLATSAYTSSVSASPPFSCYYRILLPSWTDCDLWWVSPFSIKMTGASVKTNSMKPNKPLAQWNSRFVHNEGGPRGKKAPKVFHPREAAEKADANWRPQDNCWKFQVLRDRCRPLVPPSGHQDKVTTHTKLGLPWREDFLVHWSTV